MIVAPGHITSELLTLARKPDALITTLVDNLGVCRRAAGGRAVDPLLNLMRDPLPMDRRITLRTGFVVRASTGVAPGSAGLRDVARPRRARVAVSERPS